MAKLELAEAYQRVFRGSPTSDDQSMVLADLANYSGFYKVLAGASASDLSEEAGRRQVYGRIHEHLRMSSLEMEDLEVAARMEALADATEGEN